MKKLPWFIGNALAGCMDFGVGALIAAILALQFGIAPQWWMIFVGAFFALLPDFDVVPTILMGKPSQIDHHQTLFHRPLFMLIVVPVFIWSFDQFFLATVAAVCLLWHYIHDTHGFSEGGIAWFWPFSKKYWSLIGSKKSGPVPDHLKWIQKNWLRVSTVSVRELSIGTIALMLAIYFIASQ